MTRSGAMHAGVASFYGSARQAQLLWFDPGMTTGVFICSIRPRWLLGDGPPSWSALGKAMTIKWFGQLGREPRVMDEGGRAKRTATPVVRDGRGGKGIAAILAGGGAYGGGHPSAVLSTEIATLLDQIQLLDDWPEAAWGQESFMVSQANSKPEYVSPIRVNARIEAFEIICGERGRVPFLQSSSLAKTTATDDRMRAAHLYAPGMSHATDAARHAATFLRRCRGDSTDRGQAEGAGLRAAAWPKLFGTTTKEHHREESTA